MMKQLYLLFSLIFLYHTSISQNGIKKLNGIVLDSLSNQPLPYATIQLVSNIDKWDAVTDMNGRYTFKKLAKGDYEITASYVGYRNKKIGISLGETDEITVSSIALSLENINLKEVTVKATRPFIEQSMDKVILNVAESIMANSGSSLDILRRSPSVQVNENDGSISLKGKKVIILVDGKLTQLTGESLEGFLSAMPSNSIDRIELISNPSAKYEAAGMAIINIRTLKMKSMGLNGNWNLGIGSGIYARYNGGIVLNYRKDKFSLSGNYNYIHNKQYYNLTSNRSINNLLNYSDYENDIRERDLQYAKFTMDYDITKKITVGLIFQGDRNSRDRIVSGETKIGPQSRIDSIIFLKSKGDAIFENWNTNLFFRNKQNNNSKEFSIDLDYGQYYTNWQEKIINQYVKDEFHTFYQQPISLNIPWIQKNRIQSIKADYIQPFGKTNIEAGMQLRLTTMNMDFSFEQLIEDKWIKNDLKSSIFDYTENVNAAYFNINGKKNQKLSYQLGVRAEQTNVFIENIGSKTKNQQIYCQVFPTASLQFEVWNSKRLNISYTRRINRPTYGELNGQLFYWNQYRQTQGNPYLKPTLIHSLEFGLNVSKYLTTSLNYRQATNSITVQPVLLANGATLYQTQNYKNAQVITLDNSLNKSIRSWWTTSSGFQITYTRNDFSNIPNLVNNELLSAYVYTNNYFTTKGGVKFELLAFYIPKQVFGAYSFEPRKKIDIGVQKTILRKQGDIRLNISDIFNSLISTYTISSPSINISEKVKSETRFYRLTFIYKFGNNNVKVRERKSGLDAESSRISTGK